MCTNNQEDPFKNLGNQTSYYGLAPSFSSSSSSSSADAEGAISPTEMVRFKPVIEGCSPLKPPCLGSSQTQGWTQGSQLLLRFFILKGKTRLYSTLSRLTASWNHVHGLG